MKTEIIKNDLQQAAELLKRAELVAVPTETVYGLAGNGLDESAVQKIYDVKGRPPVKPLSLMVSGVEEIGNYCEDIPDAAIALANKYWPGPLTIVLKAKEIVPEIVRAGGETVGLRCPNHSLTLETIRLSGIPLAAPSANPSGEESPKNAQKVLEYFDGSISAVIDGGECGIGTESSLIDMSRKPYKILREGALSAEEIACSLAELMPTIGITGGSGCGKTTALYQLEKMGALIIDADAVYHELLKSDRALLDEIEERFPGTVFGGCLDRKALGSIVFSDDAALKDLNRITHRHISEKINEMRCEWAMNGGWLAAIDAIELIGSGLAGGCSATIAVLADREVRIERIMSRDKIDREAAELRINAQKPDSYFKEHCLYTIYNNSEKEIFENEFNSIIQEVIGNGRSEN